MIDPRIADAPDVEAVERACAAYYTAGQTTRSWPFFVKNFPAEADLRRLQMRSALTAATNSNAALVAALQDARFWLDAALRPMRGEGPPNWDGILSAIINADAALAAAGVHQ